MILKYKGNGLFILQAHNLIQKSDLNKDFTYDLTQLFFHYITATCNINISALKDHAEKNHLLYVAVLYKQINDDFVISIGFLTKVLEIITKCDKHFEYDTETYLDISQNGFTESQSDGNEFIECERAIYKVFKSQGILKNVRVLPSDYTFEDPVVKEYRFKLYKTTRNIKEALMLYTAINDPDKGLYSNECGLYGVCIHVYGEDLKRYKTEFLCTESPLTIGMKPFTEKMIEELKVLYFL